MKPDFPSPFRSSIPVPTQGVEGVGLDTWPRDQAAIVVAVDEADSAATRDLVLRLVEIGFLPGERVRIVARGFPGGDPLAVRVGGTTFALRRHEAACIRVRAEAGA
jgi:ferrous iron transport protein A